jgi:hypothetical protein
LRRFFPSYLQYAICYMNSESKFIKKELSVQIHYVAISSSLRARTVSVSDPASFEQKTDPRKPKDKCLQGMIIIKYYILYGITMQGKINCRLNGQHSYFLQSYFFVKRIRFIVVYLVSMGCNGLITLSFSQNYWEYYLPIFQEVLCNSYNLLS